MVVPKEVHDGGWWIVMCLSMENEQRRERRGRGRRRRLKWPGRGSRNLNEMHQVWMKAQMRVKCPGCCQLATAASCPFHERGVEAVTRTIKMHTSAEALFPLNNLFSSRFPFLPFLFLSLASIGSEPLLAPSTRRGMFTQPIYPGSIALARSCSCRRYPTKENTNTFTMSMRPADPVHLP